MGAASTKRHRRPASVTALRVDRTSLSTDGREPSDGPGRLPSAHPGPGPPSQAWAFCDADHENPTELHRHLPRVGLARVLIHIWGLRCRKSCSFELNVTTATKKKPHRPEAAHKYLSAADFFLIKGVKTAVLKLRQVFLINLDIY